MIYKENVTIHTSASDIHLSSTPVSCMSYLKQIGIALGKKLLSILSFTYALIVSLFIIVLSLPILLLTGCAYIILGKRLPEDIEISARYLVLLIDLGMNVFNTKEVFDICEKEKFLAINI